MPCLWCSLSYTLQQQEWSRLKFVVSLTVVEMLQQLQIILETEWNLFNRFHLCLFGFKVDQATEDISASLNMSMRTVSETAAVAITTILSILVVIVIAGNSLVCLIVKRNRDLRYAEIWLFTIYKGKPVGSQYAWANGKQNPRRWIRFACSVNQNLTHRA